MEAEEGSTHPPFPPLCFGLLSDVRKNMLLGGEEEQG